VKGNFHAEILVLYSSERLLFSVPVNDTFLLIINSIRCPTVVFANRHTVYVFVLACAFVLPDSSKLTNRLMSKMV